LFRRNILITLNGEETIVKKGMSLLSWLNSNGIEQVMVAVEYNGEILNRSDFGKIMLKDGDKLEIVKFMGGG